MPKKTEKCGRCSASTVVDLAQMDKDEDEIANQDPFGDDRIEVEESDIRSISPGAWMAGVSDRVDDIANRVIWR